MAFSGSRIGSSGTPNESWNTVIACSWPASDKPASMMRLTDGARSLWRARTVRHDLARGSILRRGSRGPRPSYWEGFSLETASVPRSGWGERPTRPERGSSTGPISLLPPSRRVSGRSRSQHVDLNRARTGFRRLVGDLVRTGLDPRRSRPPRRSRSNRRRRPPGAEEHRVPGRPQLAHRAHLRDAQESPARSGRGRRPRFRLAAPPGRAASPDRPGNSTHATSCPISSAMTRPASPTSLPVACSADQRCWAAHNWPHDHLGMRCIDRLPV